MCFSNLPVEFDEDGNPYLADEAEDVEEVPDPDEDVAVADDPRETYEAIVASVPEGVRDHLDAGSDVIAHEPERDRAGGD